MMHILLDPHNAMCFHVCYKQKPASQLLQLGLFILQFCQKANKVLFAEITPFAMALEIPNV